jgi:hypothetical protein
MSAVIDAIEDAVDSAIDTIESVVDNAWETLVLDPLEAVMGIFGIEDETVITIQKISIPLFETNTTDVVKAGITRAILKKIKTDQSYFSAYMQEIYLTKAQVQAYYRYAETGQYYAGFPTSTIDSKIADLVAIGDALDVEFGSTHTVIEVGDRRPKGNDYFKWEMQTANAYKPWLNTLTHTDIYGTSYDDWQYGSAVYNSGPDDWTINISRTAEEAQFWIQGPGQITEGDTATFTIKSNRTIPVGETMVIGLVYTGTGTDGVDYTGVASVNMLESTDQITVDIVTAETGSAGLNFIITIDSLDNNPSIFETVTINAQDSVTCTITDDDTLRLTVNDVIVDEANTTITIDVKLELAAPSGAFSVDYNFTDLGSITGGVDYDNTTGTLNFAGTVGEVQSFTVDIFTDVVDDDREQFQIFFENSTDLDSIDISVISTVTIIDGTLDPVAGTAVLADTITKATYIKESSLIVTYSDDNDPPGQFWYWIYPYSAGTYSGLKPVVRRVDGLEMLPMVILRKNKVGIDVTPGTGSNTYITSRMAMMRLNMKIEDFIDNFNANPDIDDVDDAYFHFSIQPNDNHPLVSKLLYLAWFDTLVFVGLDTNLNEYVATYQEGDINNAIIWEGFTYTTDIVGVQTTEGDYTRTIVPAVYVSGDLTETAKLNLYYQKTATEYDHIQLRGLNGTSAINYGSYHEMAFFKLGDTEFTIPLSANTFFQLDATEQMEVYQYLLRLDFHAINITHLEWYETEDFLDLFEFAMIIISVVITVISFNAATSFVAGLWSVFQSYIIAYAIGELVMFIGEVTGNEFLAAAIGAVVAVYVSNPKMFTGDFMMQADTLLDLTSNYVDNISMLEGIETQEKIKEIEETLKEAQDKLDAEKERRNDIEAVAVDSNFMIALQSVDVQRITAIQGQYSYDSLFDYDSLVGKYVDTRLTLNQT